MKLLIIHLAPQHQTCIWIYFPVSIPESRHLPTVFHPFRISVDILTCKGHKPCEMERVAFQAHPGVPVPGRLIPVKV